MTSLVTPISHLFLTDELTNDICSLSTALEARERTSKLRLPNTTHYHIDFDLNLGLTEENISFLRNEVKDRRKYKLLPSRYPKIVKRYKPKMVYFILYQSHYQKGTD